MRPGWFAAAHVKDVDTQTMRAVLSETPETEAGPHREPHPRRAPNLTHGPRLENKQHARLLRTLPVVSAERKEMLTREKVAEKGSSELTLDARLGRQDKAGFPASGTSFLSFCLHIVLGRSPTFRRDE
jgi:hypothetical protein